MRPIDLQSIIAGIKETEKVQHSQEARQQHLAHSFEVDLERKQREEGKKVRGTAKGDLGRVEERKEKESGGKGRREEKGERRGHGCVKAGEEGSVYNGRGRIHPLEEGGEPRDLTV